MGMIPDYISEDPEFKNLAQLMDSCADSRGGCQFCALEPECLKFFDRLSTKALDAKLATAVRQEFETKFKNFKRQLSFI